jgi:chromosome segregation ATPase
MSSRAPGNPAAGMQPFRQEDERRRDEARLTTLQNQQDELRQALRELASRQVRLEETVKQYEGAGAQNRLGLEQIRQETQQSAQARALDENRTRQQMAELDQRLEDAIRPVRSLQAHVAELMEASRKKTDDSGIHQKRYDELRGMIEHLQALNDRTAVITHQLRDSMDNARAETDGLRRDLLRNEDAVKIVDQEVRRRIAEITQTGEATTVRIDELRSDVAHAFDMLEETRRAIIHVDPTLEELRQADVALRTEIVRYQQQSNERYEAMAERQEDIRQLVTGESADVRTVIEQRYERLGERLESISEQYRELGYRLSTTVHQLDELRQVDTMLRRDLWTIHEQRVRLRLEQVQHELDVVTGSRRVAEAAGPVETKAPSMRSLDT